MKIMLDFNGESQYGQHIHEKYRNSACGPLTASVMLKHYGQNTHTTNDFYKLLGTTRFGISKRNFIKNMRRVLGSEWEVEEIQIEDVKKELCAGRPVAAKFDRYFSFEWLSSFEFSYHWVPVIGFEEQEDGLYLLIHDNGGRNRPSRVRKVSFERNAPILSFIRVSPK